MINELLQQDRALKRAKINRETARIPWLELQRFFAAGKVLALSSDLDLVDVAYAIEQDDTKAVQSWTEAEKLAPVSDAQAHSWVTANTTLWAVVIKPWVLVQTTHPQKN